MSPKLLLLDEPFGMLDSLTRWTLQEVLMARVDRVERSEADPDAAGDDFAVR